MSENLMSKFNQMDELQEIHIEYLKKRGIDHEKVKHLLKSKGTAICCRIFGFNEKNDLDWINIQARYIDKTGPERFKTLPGHTAKGIYIDKIDEKKDYIIVVEGLFDFLSLVQYESNVIGLFNAGSIDPIEITKEIMKLKGISKIYFLPDNDKPGEELEYKMLNHFENIGIYHIGELNLGCKDVNDFICYFQNDFSIDGFKVYLENSYLDRIETKKKEIKDKQKYNSEKAKEVNRSFQDGLSIEFPHNQINKDIGKLKPNNLSIIIGAPNCGKTSFSLLMILRNINKGHKIGFLSYEMSMGDILGQFYYWKIPGAMERFEECRLTDFDIKECNKYKSELLDNENYHFIERHFKSPSIDDLINDIEEMKRFGATVVFIDNLIKIRWTRSEIDDNQQVIQYLYEEAHKSFSIVLLHHSDKDGILNNSNTFKGTSDVIIKPDDIIYLKRSGLVKKSDRKGLEEEPSREDKAELVVRRGKQRLGKSHAGNESKVYFNDGDYYTNEEFCNIITKHF